MSESLASLEELEKRAPGGIASQDEERAQANLDDASALIRAEAGKTWEDEDPPEVIVSICLAVAKRALENPSGIRSDSVDNYTRVFAEADSAVYLTEREAKLVWKVAGKSRLWTLGVTRNEEGHRDLPSIYDGYVDANAPSEESDPLGEGW